MTEQSYSAFNARRMRLLRMLEEAGGGLALIPTAPERTRNRDSHFPYRFDSYFYYLTGFTEPEALLVLIADETPRSILLCRAKNEEREIWDGFRHGPAAAKALFGFDDAYCIDEVAQHLPEWMADQDTLWCALGHDTQWDAHIMESLNQVRANTRSGIRAPHAIRDIRALLDDMRLIKDDSEIDTMRRAAVISAQAHRRAMRACKAGMREYEIEAELLHEFRRAGAQSPAYTSIVAGGANACVLHYVSNDRVLNPGELLLIDAGCELDGYASDITRTFPIDGRFNAAQRDIYELVLAAQNAAVAQIRPGQHWNAPHEAALKVLAQGMLDLKLLEGTLDEILESGSYRRFYMHRTGHWLGLDVHDAGEYKQGTQWRTLEAGMMLTVEPGCYIRPAADVPEAFWNIGVRIEDDALVTPQGCELITAAAPKTIAEIEAWMADA